MKKTNKLIFTLLLCASLFACNKKENIENQTAESETIQQESLSITEKNEFSLYDGDNVEQIIEDAKKNEVRVYDEFLDLSSEGGINIYIEKLDKNGNEYVNQVINEWESINFEEQSYLSQDILQLFLDLRFGQMGRFIDKMYINGASISGYKEPAPSASRIIVLDVNYSNEGYDTKHAHITHVVHNGEIHKTWIFSDTNHIEKFLGISVIGGNGVCSFGLDKSNVSEDNQWFPFDGVAYYGISNNELKEKLYHYLDFISIMNLYREKVYMPSFQEDYSERQKEYFENEEIEKAKHAEPSIGMTKEEVLNGLWGEPDKKNIDEYEWGIEEQWVYDGKGYVYFEDGIVTAIQHRE